MTTLEEVFLHLGEEEEADDNDTANADTSIRDKAMTRYGNCYLHPNK